MEDSFCISCKEASISTWDPTKSPDFKKVTWCSQINYMRSNKITGLDISQNCLNSNKITWCICMFIICIRCSFLQMTSHFKVIKYVLWQYDLLCKHLKGFEITQFKFSVVLHKCNVNANFNSAPFSSTSMACDANLWFIHFLQLPKPPLLSEQP